MRFISSILFFILILTVFTEGKTYAQAPDKISYQAVIRDSENQLLVNSFINIEISILGDSTASTIYYQELHETSTNENGLISIQIGSGTELTNQFNTLNWSNGPYFLKTRIDPLRDGNYTLEGMSQLLSVPFALHAKTAEQISGDIQEKDPEFKSSVAATITAEDVELWNNKSRFKYESDPKFSEWDKRSGIRINKSQIIDLSNNTFEKELIDDENDIDIGFTLEPTSTVFINGAAISSKEWTGQGTTTLHLKQQTKLFDNLKVIK